MQLKRSAPGRNAKNAHFHVGEDRKSCWNFKMLTEMSIQSFSIHAYKINSTLVFIWWRLLKKVDWECISRDDFDVKLSSQMSSKPWKMWSRLASSSINNAYSFPWAIRAPNMTWISECGRVRSIIKHVCAHKENANDFVVKCCSHH